MIDQNEVFELKYYNYIIRYKKNVVRKWKPSGNEEDLLCLP